MAWWWRRRLARDAAAWRPLACWVVLVLLVLTLRRDHSVKCLTGSQWHSVSYIEWTPEGGVPEARRDQVVVCVHGLTRNAHDFDYLGEYLVRSDGGGARAFEGPRHWHLLTATTRVHRLASKGSEWLPSISLDAGSRSGCRTRRCTLYAWRSRSLAHRLTD